MSNNYESTSDEDEEENEIYFELLLKESKKLDANDETLVHDLNIAFRRLLDLLLIKKKYEDLYSLINRITLDNNIRHKDELFRVCGDLFYENDLPINSIMYYRQSIRLNPLNLLSIESLENLLNSFIERWHYRMINDRTRNFAYSKALGKKLSIQSHPLRVLDIGFGCGVLTVQCLQTPNKPFVYACEQNQIFHQITEKLLKFDSKQLKLINKHSNDLSIQEDLNNAQVDLIVTEIFDDGLLGEKCLDTFYQALYVNKIIKEDSNRHFNIIPKYARLYICAIESERIRKSNFFKLSHESQTIKVLSFADCEKFSLKYDQFEPYTTENLNKIDFKKLTEPVELDKFRIEFDNYELLRDLCELDLTLKTDCKLKFVESGYVDAYVIWFDLYLDDEIIITNSPFDESTETRATCWHQAIYPTFDRIGNTEKDLVLEVSLKKDCLLINQFDDNVIKNDFIYNIWASSAEISSLNDSNYQKFFMSCFNDILFQSNRKEKTRIGLYCNSINTIILEFLAGKYENVNVELVIFSSSQNYSIDELMKNQKLTNKLKFVEIDSLCDGSQSKIDYLIFEPLDLNLGVLQKNFFSNLILLRDLVLINRKYFARCVY